MKNTLDKLHSRGAEALTDEELLTVVVAENAVDRQAPILATDLLKEAGSLQSLLATDISRLRMMSGLGLQRALRLKAATEMGRRQAVSESTAVECIASDKDVVRIMRPMLGGLQHEECWALYLASSGKLIERMRISSGGVQATVVDYRLIVKRAIELLAVQIVLVHNHPSGSAEPSAQDRTLTERVDEACRLFDIRLLDHIIIARGDHYSFRGQGTLK
ncbi:MAG: DNA repair protein RadC [Alistipes sp.]|nr:DNA repair protein RadC [Alistipes sp.]